MYMVQNRKNDFGIVKTVMFLSSFEQIGVLGNIMVSLFLIIFMNQVGI